jgi:hypothetical protein
MASPESPVDEVPSGPAYRFWGALLIVGALLLFLGGGAVENFRSDPPVFADDESLPLPIVPDGMSDELPTLFRWTPGSDETEFSQVVLHRSTFEPFWRSRPVRGDRLEISPSVFDDIRPGELSFWRVREVARGKPRAGSAFTAFSWGASPPVAETASPESVTEER